MTKGRERERREERQKLIKWRKRNIGEKRKEEGKEENKRVNKDEGREKSGETVQLRRKREMGKEK